MAKSDLKIKANDSRTGTSVTSTISYINPAATNEQLATLGAMINSFTTNVYDHSERVTTANVNTEPGGGEKPVPTLVVTKDGNPIIDGGSYSYPALQPLSFDCTYDGDGSLFVVNPNFQAVSVTKMTNGTTFQINSTAVNTVTISFGATATANYQYAPLITASFSFT